MLIFYQQMAETEEERDEILSSHKSYKETFDAILNVETYKTLLTRGWSGNCVFKFC